MQLVMRLFLFTFISHDLYIAVPVSHLPFLFEPLGMASMTMTNLSSLIEAISL